MAGARLVTRTDALSNLLKIVLLVSPSRVPTVVLISSFCKTHGRQTQMSGARKADALQALAPAERAPLASWHEPAMTIPRRSHATSLEDRPVQRPSESFIILGYTEKGESRARG